MYIVVKLRSQALVTHGTNLNCKQILISIFNLHINPKVAARGNFLGSFMSTWIVGKMLAPPNANSIVPNAVKNSPNEGLE